MYMSCTASHHSSSAHWHAVAVHRLTVRQRVTGALQIASALAFAHEKHIVHSDLHKENILRTRDESAWKLIDFGNSGRIGEVIIREDSR